MTHRKSKGGPLAI